MSRLLLAEHEWVGKWVAEKTGGTWYPGEGYGIGVLIQGVLVAGVIFTHYNKASMQIHVAAEPGVNWVSRKLLWHVFDYSFNYAKVKKLIGPVGEKNLQARRFDEKVGFVLEATLRDAHPDGDLLLYSMTREQCRWLGRGNGKRYRAAA